MPLSNDDIQHLQSLDADAARVEVNIQCHRIHRAVHDGSLDRAAVDDALARIAVINKTNDEAATPEPRSFFAPPEVPSQPAAQ